MKFLFTIFVIVSVININNVLSCEYDENNNLIMKDSSEDYDIESESYSDSKSMSFSDSKSMSNSNSGTSTNVENASNNNYNNLSVIPVLISFYMIINNFI